MNETIAAIATPPGKGGVAVLRISGPLALSIGERISLKKLKPRRVVLADFKNSQQETIDKGLAIYFRAPHSFTGEDIVELQGHGGPIVMDQLLQATLYLGARLAQPGEFSQRAFLNNKIDLTQAEAIADLINASSVQAAQSALRSLEGEFSQEIQLFLKQLIHLRMMVEASIDFPEEEIDFLSENKIEEKLKVLLKQLNRIQQSAKQGVLLQEGLTLVIAGEPNVGKSSLLNRLTGQDSAIVSPIAGTTRDILKEYIQIDGLPIHIIDTAGIRETEDVIEQEGVRRAHRAIEQADLVLLLEESGSLQKDSPNFSKPIVRVINKIDLHQELPSINEKSNPVEIRLSVKTGEGMTLLKNYLKKIAGFESGEGGFIARRRHLDALRRCESYIQKSIQFGGKNSDGELIAEELRFAQEALNEITGEFRQDDLLGEIFSSFCIGK